MKHIYSQLPNLTLRLTFAEQTKLNPKLVSARIKILCTKVRGVLDTHTIDITLLNENEQSFIKKLKLLISTRIVQLIDSSDEMVRVSY